MKMAEGGGGWWGGWVQQSFQAVKDKSAEAYEFLKRDLAEFSNVVQHDTACSIVATASAVRSRLAVEGSSEATEKVKKGLSNILGVITDTLAPPPDKTIDCDVITLMATPAGTTEAYDSTKARLYSLQADPATYCNEPDGPLEQFDSWLCSFSLEEKKGEISELLVGSPSIRALYTKMVPVAVAHSEFWQRYFYKVFQLEQEEARRVALKQRAEQTAHVETLVWEEDEEEEAELLSPEVAAVSSPPLPCDLTPVAVATTPDPAGEPGSESLSLPTQLEKRQQEGGAPEELAHKLTEASLEEAEPQATPSDRVQSQNMVSGAERVMGPRVQTKPDSLKEEGPQDLRVFELNSDSGKSTPSNNGKKGSSTDVSEDWEKDFDLDMTEEEVQLVLSKVSVSGELEDEDWENWD